MKKQKLDKTCKACMIRKAGLCKGVQYLTALTCRKAN